MVKANWESESFVEAKVNVEGIHFWDGAPMDVKFLREPHRHVFSIHAVKAVNHDDRDVEFILLGRGIRDHIQKIWKEEFKGVVQFEQTSCEMIARELFNAFDLEECRVYEDGENGGIIRRKR
jgi:hypothetical protein